VRRLGNCGIPSSWSHSQLAGRSPLRAPFFARGLFLNLRVISSGVGLSGRERAARDLLAGRVSLIDGRTFAARDLARRKGLLPVGAANLTAQTYANPCDPGRFRGAVASREILGCETFVDPEVSAGRGR